MASLSRKRTARSKLSLANVASAGVAFFADPYDTIQVNQGTTLSGAATIEVGQPARFLLLRPAGPPNTYVVQRVIGVAETTR